MKKSHDIPLTSQAADSPIAIISVFTNCAEETEYWLSNDMKIKSLME
jgi:hypothetical protein